MTFQGRVLVFLAAVLMAPAGAHAALNLGGFGDSGVGGFGDGGVVVDPTPPLPPGGGGPPSYSVSDLEEQGYVCTQGGPAAYVCTGCSLVDADETQVCTVHLCLNSTDCNQHRTRWGVPRDIDPARFRMWAREFAFGSSSYWLGDFDGDGRRDLAGQGLSVMAALSTGSFFRDVGVFPGPTPVESAGPSLLADVNHDGIADVLSVSPAGHLVVGISTGSGIAASVELTDTWCERLGDCLIGDVNGDGMPDLVEVMRGAVDGQRAGDVWVSLASDVPGFPSVPPAPVPPDDDGDGVLDNVDDCLDVPNPTQLDADGDGIGNACDADLNGDGIVDRADANLLIPCLGAHVSARPECAASDFDGDDFVSFADAVTFQAAMGQPPGRAAASQPPRIELFTPEDGTILPVGATQAWVAGWVPNLPAGSVQLRVAGHDVAVSGPSNAFSAFVDLAATDASGAPAVFHPIVVEASGGTRTTVERRAVIVGDHAAPHRRAHAALGARLTSAGLERIEQYAREHLVPDLVADVPDELDGYTSDLDCAEALGVIWPVCTTGTTIANATIAVPDVSVDLRADGVDVFLAIPSLDFDLTVHGTGPTPADWSCGGHVSVTNIQASLRYALTVGASGRVEVVELQEPDVAASVSYSGCGEDDVKAKVKDRLVGFLNDPDDVNGATHGIYQRSPVGAAIEDLFASLDLSGTFVQQEEPPVLQQMAFAPGPLGTSVFDQDPLSLDYDARFELVTQDASGISLWLAAGIDPTTPKPGLGSPQGAYQVPGLVAPALPNVLASGSPFDVAAAVTPNGLNELLDALTRAGVLAEQTHVITQIANPLGGTGQVDLTAGLLSLVIDAFGAYPPFERFRVVVSPPAFAPVVTGRLGPHGEPVDLHVPQLGITLLDESGAVALALRADVRVGVELGLGGSGTGALTAVARGFQVLDYTLTENPIGADPAQVASRILCYPEIPADRAGCALKDELTNGLDAALGPIELPSIADAAAGLSVNAQCLQRLADGSFVAEYDLLLPGESPPAGSHVVAALDRKCLAPITTDPGGASSGPLGGSIGTIGTAALTLR